MTILGGNILNHLLSKAEGVKDCVKWVEKRIKEKQKHLKETDWYYILEAERELKAQIGELIAVKISLEKYAKKLKYMAEEMEE